MKKESRVQVRPDLQDDLQRQREYVESVKARGLGFGLIVPDTFLRSMRDLGYKSTATALDELVDNSIQANAASVHVLLGYGPENTARKKHDYMAVVDDGHGMEPDMIRLAIAWGGTHRPDDRAGFGRFGYGLPSAAVSMAEAYSVYSKPLGGEWHAVHVDVRKIAADCARGERAEAPPAVREEPPEFVTDAVDLASWESGTVVVLEEPDRLGAGFVTSTSFVRKMCEHLGVTYRNFIPETKITVDGQLVDPVDPLFITEGARFCDETSVRAVPVEAPTNPIVIRLDDGTEGVVRVRASFMPMDFQLADPDNPSSRGDNKRFEIMKEFDGLLVLRAGRQIDCIRFPLFWLTLVNYDRNWKIEIDYDPVLDDLFSINTSKQQVVLTEGLWDQLKEAGLKALARDLRVAVAKSKRKLDARRAEPEGDAARASELAMKRAEKFETSKRSLSAIQRTEAEKRLDEEAERIARQTKEPVSEVRDRLAEMALQSPYKVALEARGEGPFYHAERLGAQKRLVINTDHPFFTDLYERAEPPVKSALEVLLFVLGDAELAAEGDRAAFYKNERQYWSMKLRDALRELYASGELEDEASAKLEAEESLESTAEEI